ncbi:MAG: abortive infection family protein [Alphaproteobacteria bacterium]|nr:abortive infection family protein [Alphaproteobacteria bacterium]QQS57524.1 MAG: abortive infection family protein [Alphaproteobacteria bacterium]
MPKLKLTEIETLEDAFNTGNGAGYVLDFSDRTFGLFFEEEFNVDIDAEKYRQNGSSKGKRLKSFIEQENSKIVARVLRTLWDYRASILEKRGNGNAKPSLTDAYFKIVHRLECDEGLASTDAIEKFSNNETLDELIEAIHRDIAANKPQAALDRLHTYCMKKFSHLLSVRNIACEQNEPLNSRVGKYIKALEGEVEIHEISRRIMKSSISIFDEFNDVRNNKSFAHDNEIMGLHEARFIFDSVSNILRFIRSFESSQFGG